MTTATELPTFEGQTLEWLIDHLSSLLDITDDNLESEGRKNTKIFGSLQRLHMYHTRHLEKLIDLQNQLKSKRKRYYEGKGTAEDYKREPLRESVLKSDVDSYLKVDPQMVEMARLVQEQERKVKVIEEGKKQLSDRGFTLRLALDYRRMNQGS